MYQNKVNLGFAFTCNYNGLLDKFAHVTYMTLFTFLISRALSRSPCQQL